MSLRNAKNHKIYPILLEDDHDELHSIINNEQKDVNDSQTSQNDKEEEGQPPQQQLQQHEEQEEQEEEQQLNHDRKDTFHSEVTMRLSNLTQYSQDEEWPVLMDDQAAIELHHLRRLPSADNQIRDQVSQRGKITVRSVTWNQHAQPFPDMELIRKHLLPLGYYHVIAIGTQECENSISKSLLYPSKENWERVCRDALGNDYEFIRGHSLQASHLVVFVHKAIVHLVSNINSHSVATGLLDTLGNKGGIGISFNIGKTSFCFLTAHLAAHQNYMDRRTVEFAKISREIASVLGPSMTNKDHLTRSTTQEMIPFMKRSSSSWDSEIVDTYNDEDKEHVDDDDYNDSFRENETASQNDMQGIGSVLYKSFTASLRSSCCATSICKCSKCCTVRHSNIINPLPKAFDHVIWGGDMNFRIHGSRDIVEALLQHNRYSALKDNDQLSLLLQFEKAFAGFEEGPLTFYPSYKFDKHSDMYDTSSKQRVPAWTDRILYSASPSIKLLSYASINDIKTSDHRPVYASLECDVDIEKKNRIIERILFRTESKRDLCVIS